MVDVELERHAVVVVDVEVKVLHHVALVLHVVAFPERFELLPVVPLGQMGGEAAGRVAVRDQAGLGFHLVPAPGVAGINAEVGGRGVLLEELDVDQVEVVDGIDVIGDEDEALGLGEGGAHLLEAAHVVEVLAVLALLLGHALGGDVHDVVAGLGHGVVLTDDDDEVVLLEMLAPSCHGVFELAALGPCGAVGDDYQDRVFLCHIIWGL